MSTITRMLAICIALFLLTSAIRWTPPGTALEPPEPELHLFTFADGNLSVNYTFDGGGGNATAYVGISNHAVIHRATVNLTVSPTEDGTSAPLDPSLDAAGDGSIDWSFDSRTANQCGRQDLFLFSGEDWEGTVSEVYPSNLNTVLPGRAQVSRATMEVGGTSLPRWLEWYNLTPESESTYESAPEMEEYGGYLYCAWSSADPNITTDGDSDVVLRRFNDTGWGEWEEVSLPSDVIAEGGVDLVTFQDLLYVIWHRGDSWATPGGHNELVYRTYDGTSWSTLQRISGPMDRGINTFQKSQVYDGRLYVAWKTTDAQVADVEPNGEDTDIVISSTDGTTWSAIEELTAPDNSHSDWSVDLGVHGDLLYVIWDTWEENITGVSWNKDVVYRTYDGTSWGPRINLSPASDRDEGPWDTKDSMPELMTWLNPATREEELVAYWIRGVSIIYTNGVGQRVVHRRLSGGEWGPLANISEPRPDDPVDQMFPDIIEYKDHLYAIWVLGTNTTEYIEGNISRISTYGNIMLRIFNGYSWSQVWELTLMGNGFDNASYPTMSHFGDVLFAAWKATLRTSNDTLSWEEVVRPFDLVPVQANISFGGREGATWGWQTITDGFVNASFDPDELTAALGTLRTDIWDDWNNQFARAQLLVSVDGRARVTIRNLTVLYDYTVQVDMTGDLRWAVNERRWDTPDDFMISLPINLSSGSAGRMRLHDLDVEYHLDYPPVLIEPLPPLEVDEDCGETFLTDMEEWFTDDWDDGRLAFDIIGRRGTNESFQAIDVYLDGSGLYLNPPPADWYGEMDLVVQAMDSLLYTNKTNYVTIRVLPVNDPPDLRPVNHQTLKVDEEHRELLNATDVDDPRDSLRFSTDSDVATVDPITGELRVTMRSDLPNPLVFNVTVTDPHGASDTEEVTYDYKPVRLVVTYWDWIPYALVLLLLLGLLLVVAERWRRHRRLTAEEVVWDEEAAYEEREQARSTGKWRRRSP